MVVVVVVVVVMVVVVVVVMMVVVVGRGARPGNPLQFRKVTNAVRFHNFSKPFNIYSLTQVCSLTLQHPLKCTPPYSPTPENP